MSCLTVHSTALLLKTVADDSGSRANQKGIFRLFEINNMDSSTACEKLVVYQTFMANVLTAMQQYLAMNI